MRRALAAIAFAALLVLVVAACGSSGSSTETPASAPATAPAAADTGAPGGGTSDGAAIFTSNCAGCHGVDGTGGSGPNLQGEDNLDKVVAQVTSGGENMPPFEGQLSAAEIQAVAEYVTAGFK